MSNRKNPVDVVDLAQRVSRLEADMSWVKKFSLLNVGISAGTFISILILIAELLLR